jgi:hypothetical protein
MPSLAELLGMEAQQPGGLAGLAMGGQGLAPFGLRHSGMAPKGKGFFGMLPHRGGGFSTEISTEFDIGGRPVEAPLLVPTLSASEVRHLLSGGGPTEAIYRKAFDFARQRMGGGQSPFASPTELRYPAPAARLSDVVNAQMPAPRPVPPKRTPSQGVRG